MSAAMECFRHGEDRNGMIKVRTALDLSRPVVQTHHDRQFPDLLAILLRLELDGRSDIRVNMTEHLRDLANVILEHNEPRRTMFNELNNLQIDTAGHLYIAFDTCCRHIWRTRIAENDSIKAYYGYNQASFPRILPGKFYELYEGKTDMEIASILTEVDQQFVVFDHARVCLWQTAIRFLLREQRFAPAEDICNSLLLSLIQCGGPRELYQQRQFNVDVAISHSLCGAVYEAQSRRINAISSFANCVGKRNEVLPQDFWDPIRAGALEKMEHLAIELGITGMADDCKRQLRVMDAAMAEEDKRR
ncbi:hypothetical protein BKA63DRAFT_28560 [Paraphoma chrysanthemicola]|nr:hypothetical protein BKA63DRAFT_28560 [Paraphoma chrysanthemicola]